MIYTDTEATKLKDTQTNRDVPAFRNIQANRNIRVKKNFQANRNIKANRNHKHTGQQTQRLSEIYRPTKTKQASFQNLKHTVTNRM